MSHLVAYPCCWGFKSAVAARRSTDRRAVPDGVLGMDLVPAKLWHLSVTVIIPYSLVSVLRCCFYAGPIKVDGRILPSLTNKNFVLLTDRVQSCHGTEGEERPPAARLLGRAAGTRGDAYYFRVYQGHRRKHRLQHTYQHPQELGTDLLSAASSDHEFRRMNSDSHAYSWPSSSSLKGARPLKNESNR